MSDDFIDVPAFGRLRWDDKYTIFGEFEYAPGLSVQIELSAEFEEIDEEEVFGAARKALGSFRKNERQIRMQTAGALQAHRPDAGPKLSDPDVANSLQIKKLTFDEDGALSVDWQCGDLFSGRRVYTHVGANGEFAQAGVARGED